MWLQRASPHPASLAIAEGAPVNKRLEVPVPGRPKAAGNLRKAIEVVSEVLSKIVSLASASGECGAGSRTKPARHPVNVLSMTSRLPTEKNAPQLCRMECLVRSQADKRCRTTSCACNCA